VLSGKYKPGQSASDMRRNIGLFKDAQLAKLMPLLDTLRNIGEAHGGKTPAQVALNWLVRQPNVLVIPGAKNVRHVQTSLDAISWEMTGTEAEQIAQASSKFR
jgi:aryl-alcohol dehydrogenase-like predicted oxidoreductase